MWKSWIAWVLAGSGGFVVAQLVGQLVSWWDLVTGLMNLAGLSPPEAWENFCILISPLSTFLPMGLASTLVGVVIAVEVGSAVLGVVLRVCQWVFDLVPTGG
jgi:hypothetical protein